MTAAPRLRKGSRVAVVSPASYAQPDLVTAGIARLRQHGYDPLLMPNALARGPLYYAGTAAERVADLHAAFADVSIEGILCTRGGWGSAELLPHLDRDLILANRKVFVGYSDHTSLQTWFWNECGLPTFYAPMVAADWSKPDGVDTRSWDSALESGHGSLTQQDGLTILRPGVASGRLMGGCLSILTESLGTPFAFRLTGPTILFLEDIGTKPYKWDRLIQHLRFAGIFEQVTGVVFGDMSQNIEPHEAELMTAALLHALGDFHGPVAMGLKCGHLACGNRSLILGAPASLICETLPSLKFAEAI